MKYEQSNVQGRFCWLFSSRWHPSQPSSCSPGVFSGLCFGGWRAEDLEEKQVGDLKG